jgi:hypothetical protein
MAWFGGLSRVNGCSKDFLALCLGCSVIKILDLVDGKSLNENSQSLAMLMLKNFKSKILEYINYDLNPAVPYVANSSSLYSK